MQEETLLYKFYPVNINALRSLLYGYVWLADPATFNDPLDNIVSYNDQRGETCFEDTLDTFDSDRAIKALKKRMSDNNEISNPPSYLLELIETLPNNHSNFEAILRNAHLVLSSFGFACFSKSYNNMSLWSHYADGHKGFCLAFELSERPNELDLKPIKYEDTIKTKVSIIDLIEGGQDFAKTVFCTKQKGYAWEREWRLAKNYNSKFRIDDEMRKCSFPPPKKVIFGLETSEEDQRIIGKLCPRETVFEQCKLNTKGQIELRRVKP